MSEDESPLTKSAEEANDEDEAKASTLEGEESEKQHDEDGEEEQPAAATQESAPNTPSSVQQPNQMTPQMPANVPIQPYFPPYPYPHYPAGMPFAFPGAGPPTNMTVYTDCSAMMDPPADTRRNRGGVTEPFPEKLHRMLEVCEREGLNDVVSFFSHGRAFAIHKPRRFQTEVMHRFFRQTRLTSFQRQLNLYGFKRISQGPDHGGYYHELFLKGRPGLSINLKRTKIKGTKLAKRDYEGEPNFYSMPPVTKPGQPPAPGAPIAPQPQAAPGVAAPPQAQPFQPPPFGYIPQGYAFPPQNPMPYSAAQSPAPVDANGQPQQQQQQLLQPQPQMIAPYPPFFGYPPPWAGVPAGSSASSPTRPSAPPTPAAEGAAGGEDASPTKSDVPEPQSV